MNTILERLHKNSKSFGLKISISKTKVMLVGDHPENAICNIGSVQLENDIFPICMLAEL